MFKSLFFAIPNFPLFSVEKKTLSFFLFDSDKVMADSITKIGSVF